jgi:hypothetical protein
MLKEQNETKHKREQMKMDEVQQNPSNKMEKGGESVQS